MEDFEREEGISLLAILKVIFGRKLLLLIVSVASAVFLFLVIQFGLNSLKQVYQASFSFSDPNMINGKYVDGAGFNYNSLITRENLESIKSSNDLYKSINLDAIYENNGISITVEEVYSLDEATLRSQTYTLKANKKYFTSAKQARAFIKDIIETSTRTNRDKVRNLYYDSNFEAYDNATTLDAKLYYLKNQYNYINTRYKTLKDTYSDFVISSTNRSLTSYESDFKAAFYLTDYSVDALNSSLINNVYVLNYAENEDLYRDTYTTYQSMYNSNIITIENTSETLAQILAKIKYEPSTTPTSGSSATQTTTNSKETLDLIASLEKTILDATLANTDYATKIQYYQNVLELLDTEDDGYHARASQEDSEKFLQKLDAAKEKLEEYTDTFKMVESEVLTANNNVYYTYNNVIVIGGGLKLVYAIIVSIVGGFVIGACVNLIVDFKKLVPEEPKTSSGKDPKKDSEEKEDK